LVLVFKFFFLRVAIEMHQVVHLHCRQDLVGVVVVVVVDAALPLHRRRGPALGVGGTSRELQKSIDRDQCE
jgi:hypothetical protein